MELEKQETKKKIYKDSAMYAIAFIGGPLAAGYIIAENFKSFNDKEKYKTTWIITLITMAIIFGTLLILPDSIKVPNYLIPILTSAIAAFLIRKYQGKLIEEHVANGGEMYSGWRALGAGLICALITLAAIVPFAILIVMFN